MHVTPLHTLDVHRYIGSMIIFNKIFTGHHQLCGYQRFQFSNLLKPNEASDYVHKRYKLYKSNKTEFI